MVDEDKEEDSDATTALLEEQIRRKVGQFAEENSEVVVFNKPKPAPP